MWAICKTPFGSFRLSHLTSISGLNFVVQNAASSGRPAVVMMALGGLPSTTLDNAVTAVSQAFERTRL
jgi:hypothetical protein